MPIALLSPAPARRSPAVSPSTPAGWMVVALPPVAWEELAVLGAMLKHFTSATVYFKRFIHSYKQRVKSGPVQYLAVQLP